MIRISLNMNPVAKKRPRFAVRGKFARAYKSEVEVTEEGRVMLEIQRQFSGPPLQGPLKIHMVFIIPRPASHYGTGKNADKLKPSSPKYPIAKPDIDNCMKFYMDCLNRIAWADDSQICACLSSKCYSKEKGMGKVEIVIDEIDDESIPQNP